MQQATQSSTTTSRVKDFWEAGSCGTNRTDRPKHTREYFAEIEEFRYRYEPYIHQFAQFTRWYGKDMLEVGVGAGSDFLQFARGGAHVHGVDLTEEAVENVQARLALDGLQAADLQACNAERLPYADESFDLVYSWGVIHHAENMERVFDEIYRVTRPGGTVKIMVYNVNSTHTWFKYIWHALLRGKPFHGRRWAIYHFQESYATKVYSRSEITQLLKQYPHRDVRFSFWDQLIRPGAKFETTRRLIQNLTPPSMRWYMAFEFQKESR